jgi:hypothetical protein
MDQWNVNRSRPPDNAGFRSDSKDRDSKRRDEDKRRERLDAALDRGLEDTFPGSDPVSIIQPSGSVYDRRDAQKR